jgi:hypothetical protein
MLPHIQDLKYLCSQNSLFPLYYSLAASNALPTAPTQLLPIQVLGQGRAIPHTQSTAHGRELKAMPQTLCQ